MVQWRHNAERMVVFYERIAIDRADPHAVWRRFDGADHPSWRGNALYGGLSHLFLVYRQKARLFFAECGVYGACLRTDV